MEKKNKGGFKEKLFLSLNILYEKIQNHNFIFILFKKEYDKDIIIN